MPSVTDGASLGAHFTERGEDPPIETEATCVHRVIRSDFLADRRDQRTARPDFGGVLLVQVDRMEIDQQPGGTRRRGVDPIENPEHRMAEHVVGHLQVERPGDMGLRREQRHPVRLMVPRVVDQGQLERRFHSLEMGAHLVGGVAGDDDGLFHACGHRLVERVLDERLTRHPHQRLGKPTARSRKS